MEPNSSSGINNAYSRDYLCLHYSLQDLQRSLKLALHTEAQGNSCFSRMMVSSFKGTWSGMYIRSYDLHFSKLDFFAINVEERIFKKIFWSLLNTYKDTSTICKAQNVIQSITLCQKQVGNQSPFSAILCLENSKTIL